MTKTFNNLSESGKNSKVNIHFKSVAATKRYRAKRYQHNFRSDFSYLRSYHTYFFTFIKGRADQHKNALTFCILLLSPKLKFLTIVAV
jgi:hypothetical protein